MKTRILIVGGVAGGASAAARLRRLDESAEIVVFDRGPHVSFANCGLPYFVGNVIADEGHLLLASRELFRERFNIDVQTEHEVLGIDRVFQTLRVRDCKTGVEREERWDKLVLAPGASPIRPALPGVDLPGVFVVRNIPDSRKIRRFIDAKPCKSAVVVGGGFIGLEMAENLMRRELDVTVLERLPQVLPQLDPEMAQAVKTHLETKGLHVLLSTSFTGIVTSGSRLQVNVSAGLPLETDLVILALGVRPETMLARDSGLVMGKRGGIVVDEHMQTSDPRIVAVGDAVEVRDVVSGQEVVLPLAGPANRQGRVAAETLAGRSSSFRGVQATAVVGVLGVTAASTGATEKGLRAAGRSDFQTVYLHPGHHAGYYPGSQPLHLKLLFGNDGRILGAQAVGAEGVDKRIDVIATMLQMRGTVDDLAEVELCYAPQFGSAKDPVNVAGMMAQNVLRGEMPLADWARVLSPEHWLVDVREPEEFAAGHVPGAQNWPLSTLRAHAMELARDRPLWLYCAAGQRAYFAQRLLMQLGYDAKTLSGGYKTWLARAQN